jgi:surface polysaccharide O-acyltransferase-like enzyme
MGELQNPDRLTHPDQLRALAILLMVMVHAAATWTPKEVSITSFLAFVISGLGGLAAPLFVTIGGWGVARSRLTKRKILIRSSFLLTCQILVNLAAPHLFEPFTPGILSLFAITILLSPLWLAAIRAKWKNGSPVWPVILTIVVFLPWVFPSAMGPSNWDSRVHTPTIISALQHLLLTGTYPLIPWLAFAMLGAIIADHRTAAQVGKEHSPAPHPILYLIIAGIAFFFMALGAATNQKIPLALPNGRAVLTFFPANTPFLICAFTGVGILWQATKKLPHYQPLSDLGQRSLTVYVVHFIPFTFLDRLDEVGGWSTLTCSLVVLAYTLLWIPLAHLHARFTPTWSLEHLLRNLVAQPIRKLENR